MSAYVKEGEATRLTGKSHTTIQRAGKSGKVSFKKDVNGRRVYSVIDLEQVFGFVEDDNGSNNNLRESSRMHNMEKKILEQQITALSLRADALERERNDWKEQASKWEQQAQNATRLLSHEQEKNATAKETSKKGLLARIFG